MFGWITRRYYDLTRWSTDQTQILYLLPEDSRMYLDALSRQEITRRVEWLLQTFGIVKEGGRGVARHTCGKGISLQLNTSDRKWNAEAEAQFEEYAITPSRFDLAGRRNFYQAQHTAVEQRIWRGEFFASATNNPRWNNEPCWQLWDTNEIRTPEDFEDGKDTFDGVKLDEHHNPLGYFVRANNARGWDFIDASAMVHWYQPTGINQVRGESDFAPAIKRLVHWHDLEKLVVQHAKTHSALAVAVKKLARVNGRGAFGAIKRAADRDAVGGGPRDPNFDTAALEKAYPGLVAYLGENGEVQLISGNSPNEKLQPFLSDLIAPNIFASIGLPSEFFWPAHLSGQDRRFVLAKADLTFKILADELIYTWLNAVAFRFIQHRIETGKLDAPNDPNWSATMTWQTPERVTVDNGRDGALEINMLANGTMTLRGIYDKRGLGWRQETRQWIREWIEFEEMAREEGANDMQIARLLNRWRAGLPGANSGSPEKPDPRQAPDKLEDDKPKNANQIDDEEEAED